MDTNIIDTEVEDTNSEALKNRKERIKAAASEKIREGKEKVSKAHHTAEDYIKENPTKCVLGALGLGVVLGLIIRR